MECVIWLFFSGFTRRVREPNNPGCRNSIPHLKPLHPSYFSSPSVHSIKKIYTAMFANSLRQGMSPSILSCTPTDFSTQGLRTASRSSGKSLHLLSLGNERLNISRHCLQPGHSPPSPLVRPGPTSLAPLPSVPPSLATPSTRVRLGPCPLSLGKVVEMVKG